MIILACATERELRCVSTVRNGVLDGETLHMGGRSFVLCVTGMGPVAAGISAGEILTRYPETTGMINVGICGSFDAALLPLGCVCTAQREVWPEYGVRTETETTPLDHHMFPDLPLAAPNELVLDPEGAAALMGLSLPETWARGVSLTVAGVSGCPGRANFLRRKYAAAVENMEGFALALAARRRGLPFLEIRTVSNQVGERDKNKWDFRGALNALQGILPALLAGC
jgi:futalosine hydrolase